MDDGLNHDDLFTMPGPRGGDFEFDESVAAVFDDMLQRSVPFYLEQQRMISELAPGLWPAGSDVYDLGCSTATTLINLSRVIPAPARLVGYDNSAPMLARARQKVESQGLQDRITLAEGDLNGDLARLPLNNAGVVTLCWTMQFVRPLGREALARWIADSLVEGGVLLVTEKILAGQSRVNQMFVEAYYDLKRRNAYTDHEIARKREALENVLVPYRLDENRELFLRNGFAVVETFFQWYNFAGFACFKHSPR